MAWWIEKEGRSHELQVHVGHSEFGGDIKGTYNLIRNEPGI